MNIHRLRNFFSVQVASAVGQQVSEILLGHSDRYGGAYTGRSAESMEEAYTKAEPVLTIGTTSAAMEINTKEIDALKSQLAMMQDAIKSNNLAFQNQMAKMMNDLKLAYDAPVKEHEESYDALSDVEKSELAKLPRPHLTK